MKSNAHLYLPWSVVAEWVDSNTYPTLSRQQRRSVFRAAKVEKLDGGCELYWLPTASAVRPIKL